MFRNSLLKSGQPNPNHAYKIHDPLGVKLLTRLRLGLSQTWIQSFMFLHPRNEFNKTFFPALSPLNQHL